MNKTINKNINKYTFLISIFILATLLTTQASAQVDSSFTYQGELQDNNSPANDSYDFLFNLTDSSGFPFGDPSEHLNTDVVNGLFSLNVDFNIDSYDGFGDVSFSIEVRKTIDGGAYTTLGSQTIQAVPLATSLTNGDAMTGEVLTFNGFQWAPITPVSSPWNLNSSNLSYTAGDVGIGTASPAADLMIDADDQSDALRVRINSSTKLAVNENGGTAIGSFSTPPEDGLSVNGDVKQPISSNGMMKYMVHASCGNNNSTIVKSYNGIDSGNITITDEIQAGRCDISFPADLTDRYIQVSALFGVPGRAATCSISGNELQCNRFNPSTLSGANGGIMVLVY